MNNEKSEQKEVEKFLPYQHALNNLNFYKQVNQKYSEKIKF